MTSLAETNPKSTDMKTSGTEEHFITEDLLAAWSRLDPPSAPATHSSDRPPSHGPIQRTTAPSENKPKGRRVTTETGTRQPAGSDMTEFRPFRVEIGATDDARYITGQTLGVDGGLFLHA